MCSYLIQDKTDLGEQDLETFNIESLQTPGRVFLFCITPKDLLLMETLTMTLLSTLKSNNISCFIVFFPPFKMDKNRQVNR